MQIAPLDNSVFFKKAFTDMFVFKAFVKDIVGIEVNPKVIETEKSFQPKLGSIDFKYDIFAEDIEKRVIIEIQKVEYDHNFDRFLHYHLQAIAEQQRTSDDYSVRKTVYTIVLITAPYRVNKKTGEVFKDEVLISSLNPRNLHGIERETFNHKLIFLNPNYKADETPQNYRDWLELVYESIHHAENADINLQNEGVRRAANIVSFEKISPQEWEQSKIQAGKLKVLEIQYEEGFSEGIEKATLEIAQKAILQGFDNEIISKLTGLEIKQIESLRKAR
jgi:predicted transposase/invertase (TIGR01784 family)